MPYHFILSQLRKKSLCERVVGMLMNPLAKFNTSVTLQFIKETYSADWDVRSWTSHSLLMTWIRFEGLTFHSQSITPKITL
jgi:hypothetical protein